MFFLFPNLARSRLMTIPSTTSETIGNVFGMLRNYLWNNSECESVPYHTRFQDTVYLESVGIAFPAISENVSLWNVWKTFFGKMFLVEIVFPAISVRNRVFCDSWRPSWGKNVLRGLSNKCLMRGTFPAILVFLRFYLMACLEVKTAKFRKSGFWVSRQKQPFLAFSPNPDFRRCETAVFAVFVKIDKTMFVMVFHFHETRVSHENM